MSSLSRSANTSPLGKLTSAIPATKIDDETFDGATRMAREAGMTLSEWVRTLVMVRVHGIDSVAMMHADRLRVVSGMGNLNDPKGHA